MNKRGFSLIEILAVIVILGLLATLIIPMVTDSLEDSRQNIARESALGYVRAIDEYAIRIKMSSNTTLNANYNIDRNGNLVNSVDNTEVQGLWRKKLYRFILIMD